MWQSKQTNYVPKQHVLIFPNQETVGYTTVGSINHLIFFQFILVIGLVTFQKDQKSSLDTITESITELLRVKMGSFNWHFVILIYKHFLFKNDGE